MKSMKIKSVKIAKVVRIIKKWKFHIIGVICVAIIVMALANSCRKIEHFTNEKKGTCTSCNSGDGNGGNGGNSGDDKLLPIMDAKFNLREICKNSLLLEDHLMSKRKRCHDCIRKHFLIIEGLGDEAKTLDKDGQYNKELETVSSMVYQLQKDYLAGKDMNVIGQDLRKVRKNLVPLCYDEVKKF